MIRSAVFRQIGLGDKPLPTITNPMDGLVSLQAALDAGFVQMQPCDVYPELTIAGVVSGRGGDKDSLDTRQSVP